MVALDEYRFFAALNAELPSAVLRETAPLLGRGYMRPLYLAPVYQQKAAWAYHPAFGNQDIAYPQGLCPVAENMHYNLLFTHEFMRPGMQESDLTDVVNAFEKIFANIDELR